MSKKTAVKLTANFERNLVEIERFLIEADAPRAFEGLLDELQKTVLPNLERFPEMGRPFLGREARSVEAAIAITTLKKQLTASTPDAGAGAIRELVMKHCLLLYAMLGGTIYLLAIRDQRQLSFDFDGHWEG